MSVQSQQEWGREGDTGTHPELGGHWEGDTWAGEIQVGRSHVELP